MVNLEAKSLFISWNYFCLMCRIFLLLFEITELKSPRLHSLTTRHWFKISYWTPFVPSSVEYSLKVIWFRLIYLGLSHMHIYIRASGALKVCASGAVNNFASLVGNRDWCPPTKWQSFNCDIFCFFTPYIIKILLIWQKRCSNMMAKWQQSSSFWLPQGKNDSVSFWIHAEA